MAEINDNVIEQVDMQFLDNDSLLNTNEYGDVLPAAFSEGFGQQSDANLAGSIDEYQKNNGNITTFLRVDGDVYRIGLTKQEFLKLKVVHDGEFDKMYVPVKEIEDDETAYYYDRNKGEFTTENTGSQMYKQYNGRILAEVNRVNKENERVENEDIRLNNEKQMLINEYGDNDYQSPYDNVPEAKNYNDIDEEKWGRAQWEQKRQDNENQRLINEYGKNDDDVGYTESNYPDYAEIEEENWGRVQYEKKRRDDFKKFKLEVSADALSGAITLTAKNADGNNTSQTLTATSPMDSILESKNNIYIGENTTDTFIKNKYNLTQIYFDTSDWDDVPNEARGAWYCDNFVGRSGTNRWSLPTPESEDSINSSAIVYLPKIDANNKVTSVVATANVAVEANGNIYSGYDGYSVSSISTTTDTGAKSVKFEIAYAPTNSTKYNYIGTNPKIFNLYNAEKDYVTKQLNKKTEIKLSVSKQTFDVTTFDTANVLLKHRSATTIYGVNGYERFEDGKLINSYSDSTGGTIFSDGVFKTATKDFLAVENMKKLLRFCEKLHAYAVEERLYIKIGDNGEIMKLSGVPSTEFFKLMLLSAYKIDGVDFSSFGEKYDAKGALTGSTFLDNPGANATYAKHNYYNSNKNEIVKEKISIYISNYESNENDNAPSLGEFVGKTISNCWSEENEISLMRCAYYKYNASAITPIETTEKVTSSKVMVTSSSGANNALYYYKTGVFTKATPEIGYGLYYDSISSPTVTYKPQFSTEVEPNITNGLIWGNGRGKTNSVNFSLTIPATEEVDTVSKVYKVTAKDIINIRLRKNYCAPSNNMSYENKSFYVNHSYTQEKNDNGDLTLNFTITETSIETTYYGYEVWIYYTYSAEEII